MAIDLRQQLERVNAKTTLVLEKYALMQTRLEQARAEIERLNAELRSSRQSIEKLELQLEYLSVSHTVASSDAELERTKTMIEELVREIDSCIADLSD